MADFPTVGGITGPLRIPGSPGYAAPDGGIATDSSQGSGMGGGSQQAQMREMQQLFIQMLSDPAMLKMLAQAMAQGGAGMGSPGGMMGRSQFGQSGYVDNPTGSNQDIWGGTPQSGPVQWMGGMPPGYNDKVARTLGKTAIGGNILSQILPALLGGGRR